ncbi:MAG TPA: hypothetical protein VFH51_05310, partial [Myxococcota bacterium]|nr:hypothetical protein [Myxococcota bacterium]
LAGELDTARGQIEALRAELQDAEAHGRDQAGELTHGIQVRDEAIEKLKSSVETGRARLNELQEQLSQAQVQSEQALSIAHQERDRTADILTRTRKALEVAQKLLA